MTSQIIPTNPTAGSASTSSVRENFRIADEEITKLQRANIDAQELTGGPISYSVTYPLVESAFEYIDGMRIAARVNVTNSASGVLSLSVNNSTSILLKSLDGSALAAGDLAADQYYEFILNSPGGGATPYFACVNINKNFKEVSVEGITVTSPVLGSTAGNKTIQAEFKTTNANASYLNIQDERWEDGSNWNSASKLLQFGIDADDHAYIASSTEGSGLRGIEIGTHEYAGAREKFFVGDADGGVSLYYDNVKKLETTDDGILLTGGFDATQTPAQPSIVLRSEEGGSTNNQLGEIVFQGKNNIGQNHTFAYMRAESPVHIDNEEKGKIEYYIRKAGNAYQNALNITSVGIDVPGSVNAVSIGADYINLNGNNPLDPEAPLTGDVLCKRIRFDDPTDEYNDLFQIYAEKSPTSGNTGAMVLEAKDNADDKIIFRMGNYNETGAPQFVDILTANATEIRIPATKRLKFGSEADGHLELFEADNGNGYLKQVGTGNLVIQGNEGFIYGDSHSVAAWNNNNIFLRYQSANKFTTESFGTKTTGISKAANFQCDVNQIVDDTTWSVFSRNGGSNALYVQQGGTATDIASFRKGDLNAGAGTEVLGVRPGGIVVGGTIQGQHVANNGDVGVTATVSNPTNFTIRNGLITAIS
ncbi:hypothetical protein N9123_01120 [Pseudomonadales bacterium]|nr:hypothetical protein [Pseudomonadales bacterium]